MENSNPYQTPEAEVSVDEVDAKVQTPKFFAIRGRLGRMRYWCYSMASYVFAIVMAFIGGIVSALIGMDETAIEPLIMSVMLVAMLPMMLIFTIRRGNDMDKSNWYGLLMFIPLANIIYGFYLTFYPGNYKENEYGLPPSENSTTLKIGFGFAVLFMLASIVISIMGIE